MVERMPEREFLLDVLRGQHAAVDLCQMLAAISQVWDDLVDRDREVSIEQVNNAFFAALIRVPANTFYQQYFADLHPLLQSAAYDYLAANELERGSSDDQALAFVLRDNLVAMVTQCAALVGGHRWAITKAADIRRYFHDEKAADYVRKLKEKVA